jgi:hypothetical protein
VEAVTSDLTILITTLIKELPAILMAVAACIAAVGTIVNYVISRRIKADVKTAADLVVVKTTEQKAAAAAIATLVTERSDVQDQKLDHITVQTNSRLSEALARIDQLEALVKRMAGKGLEA